jgi:hypothetical protein
LPSRLVTRLTAYHISRHVASDQNRLGKLPGHDTAHDPVHYPYSGCRIVNKQLLYRVSDRKSLNFYRSYLAEHLSDKDLGTIHWIPKILCS